MKYVSHQLSGKLITVYLVSYQLNTFNISVYGQLFANSTQTKATAQIYVCTHQQCDVLCLLTLSSKQPATYFFFVLGSLLTCKGLSINENYYYD